MTNGACVLYNNTIVPVQQTQDVKKKKKKVMKRELQVDNQFI